MFARILIVFVFLSGLALGFGGFKLTRSGYETPAYQLVESVDGIELRDYPALGLASTGYARLDGADGSFMRLFRYIDGGNARSEKIEMTTPVLMTLPSGTDSDTPAAGDMSFVLPKKVTEEGAPRPTGQTVELKTQPAMRCAVLRFARRETAPAAVERLSQWLTARGVPIAAEGAPIVAFYDPPWTPAALQRNEVLIPVEPTATLQPPAPDAVEP